jgi:predicted RNA-binding Zn ribbon-like protein
VVSIPTKKNQAPGPLDAIRLFVNTVDLESGKDQLDEPEKLGEWLRERGLLEPGVRVHEEDRRQAVRVREALRSMLLANAGHEPAPDAPEILDKAARRARLGLRFIPDGTGRLEPGMGGVDGALGRLLAIAATAMAEGTWSRLKACRSDTCQWAFYDNTRNRSGVWCSMAVCGNREKVRAYRRRRSAR